MSTKPNETNEKNSFTTIIKLEDDDSTYNKSSELDTNRDYYSTSSNRIPTLSSAYKGKIEVTSKGRRKIFDGVRWQILCRRAECRKQTNKKSLCITHYKEEYETNKCQSLCKYNNNCRNIAKSSSLCINHFQIKQRESFQLHNKNDRRQRSSGLDFSKHLKNNGDFQISPSSITNQFHINSNENSCTSSNPVDNNLALLSTSKTNLTDQSVQTDLSIPLCCKIYQKNHSIFSTCTNNKSASSI